MDEIMNVDEKIRQFFPILSQQVHGKPLIYLDNAATTQKPITVTDAVSDYYETINSNVHRGAHYLSTLATEAYEKARIQVQKFINAKYSHEIIFTRGTTEGINLVAATFAQKMLKADDEVIVSRMEHHSNIVPWQLACEKSGAVLKVVGIDQNGDLLLDDYQQLFTKKTKIVAITHTSNSLGTINPIKQIVDIAHQHQVPVLLDGAQGIKSCGIDVQAVDCDFYCFSGHKIYAPMGIGVLYGKEHWLEQLPPYQGGGEMIKHVSFEKTTFNDLPFKFEAGTPNVAGAIGLQHALQFVEEVGHQQMIDYEKELLRYAVEQMKEIENIRLIGTAKEKSAIISFLLGNHHPADTGTLIDFMGIAVRTGHHCTQPLMDYLNIPGTVRASFAVYNTKREIDVFVKALRSAQNMLD